MNGGAENDGSMLDRRRFMKYTFNAAGGAIAMASLGSVGFASFLMGQADTGGEDTVSSIGFQGTGRHSLVWCTA